MIRFNYKYVLCRLCLCNNSTLCDIHSSEVEKGFTVAGVISDLLQFNVSKTDGHPQLVCLNCLHKLYDFKKFKEKCENAKSKFEMHLQSQRLFLHVRKANEKESGTVVEKVFPITFRTKMPEADAKNEVLENLPATSEQQEENVILEHNKCHMEISNGQDLVNHANEHSREAKLLSTDLKPKREASQDDSKELNSFGGSNSHEQSVQKQSSDDQANQNMEGNQLTSEYHIKEEPDQESVDPLAEENVEKNMTDDSAANPKTRSLLLCIPITKSYPKTSQCSDDQNKLYQQKNVPSMMKSEEERRGEVCEVCGKSFAQKYTLKIHMNSHMRVKPFQCEICKKDFAQSSTMKKHMSRSHVEKKYQCDLCPKKFAKEKCLASHVRIHRGHRPFQCNWCNHGFCSKEALDKHAAWHAGEVWFKCDYCGKEFDHKRKMSWHIRCSHVAKPHACSICSSSFKTLSLLRNHMTLHTGERNYMCEVCGKTFRQKKNLKVHRRVHTGEKPYQCDLCEKRYTQRNGLVAHLRKHHR